jgi:hypothetical protein
MSFWQEAKSRCPFGGKQEGTLSIQNLPLSKLAVYAINERQFGGCGAHSIGILAKRSRAQIGKELD